MYLIITSPFLSLYIPLIFVEPSSFTYSIASLILEEAGNFVTGKNEIGAAPHDIEEEFSELMDEMIDFPSDQVLTAAAYFHVKFENIHPFADGNGRTGRILMNYLLLIDGHPPIIIYEEDRKEYYSALEAWDERQELDPMISFLKEQTVKTWIKRVQ